MATEWHSIKQRVYDTIAESGEISRVRLAEKYGIRLATVTEATRKLLKDRLIIEAGEEKSTGGRKPVLLKINPDAFYTIGISVTRSKLFCGVLSAGMEPKLLFSESTEPGINPDEFIALLKRMVRKAIDMFSGNPRSLKGIGVGFPGNVDIVNGVYNGTMFYYNLRNVQVKVLLEKEFGIPVVVDHDVSLMAMAEYYLSKAGSTDNFGVLYVGWGIGCRFILNGELYRGVSNRASEFGHFSVDPDGPECYCGRRGCLERLASTEAVEKAYGKGKNFEEVVELARGGDEAARKILLDCAGNIAKVCANIVNLMDVDMLVINGDLVIARDIIEDQLRTLLDKYSFGMHPNTSARVVFSSIGQKVGVLGPALIAADRYYLEKDINIFPNRKTMPVRR